MTVEEYQEFVKKSASFQAMSPVDQQRVLFARGADMEGFIQIFTEEQKLLKSTVADFYDKSDQVVKDFKKEVKVEKKEKLKKEETKEKTEAAQVADKLLNMLDKL